MTQLIRNLTSASILLFIGILFSYSEVLFAETIQEIPDQSIVRLIKQKRYYAKEIRFCFVSSGKENYNDISVDKVGSIYLTEAGILHRGKRDLLIRWQYVKKIAKPIGQTDLLRIWFHKSSKKVLISDYRRTGNTSSLDNSIEMLLHALKKNHKKYYSMPLKPLPITITTPAAENQSKGKDATLRIQTGMSPDQVIKILGTPEKHIKLERKTILQYPDMNYIFEDGKLKDVKVR